MPVSIFKDRVMVFRSGLMERPDVYTDIHDRVNYAVYTSGLSISPDRKTITLSLKIDTGISAVMDYFEIFLTRMLMCRKAAEFLGLQFQLQINDTQLL